MATIQERNKSFRILFCYHGKRYSFTLGEVPPKEAELTAANVDRLLLRLAQNFLHLPPGCDIVTFVRNDGVVPESAEPAPAGPVTFAAFKERYLDTHRNGAMEKESLKTVAMYLNHFERTLGQKFPVQSLTLADLQRHVNRRREKKYRGRPPSPVTLRKEMASFRAAWNWGVHMGMLKGLFPSRGVVYPKADEQLPFMTWAEIKRRITPVMTEAEKAELWDCLYLTRPEVEQLLTYVKENAAHGWVYPMFCFALHTGARRSEMLRVLVSDVDFDAGTVLIREKKRSRKQRTTRRVPLTPFLTSVLQEWLAGHPGGQYLFCQQGEVFRSKKRSKTTGHKDQKTRPTSLKARMASVTRRSERLGFGPITRDEAHDHFRRTLAGSQWAVVPGWHCFRHTFISLAASRGVDQRLIDEWVGHQTEEQRKRYRHLLPSVQQQAIRSVFGGK